MHISQRVAFLWFWERWIFFHDKVKQSLDHLNINTPFLNSWRTTDESNPYFEVLLETSPILANFTAEHHCVSLQEIANQLILLARFLLFFCRFDDINDDTLQQIFDANSGWPFNRQYIRLPVLTEYLQELPTVTSNKLFKSLGSPLSKTHALTFFNGGSQVEALVT